MALSALFEIRRNVLTCLAARACPIARCPRPMAGTQTAAITDSEAFLRPLGGYFRDRFSPMPDSPEKLSVLFVSPYPICPPVHGGGVFMYQTTMELAKLCHLHLIVLLDFPSQQAAHDELVSRCASASFLVRMTGRHHSCGSILPHAVSEFRNDDLEWLIQRQIYAGKVDVLQLEYTPLGQYAGQFQRLCSILFEHDIYFQSIGRQLPNLRNLKKGKPCSSIFEPFASCAAASHDRIQVCSRDNRDVLVSFLPGVASRIDEDLRAGIATDRYAKLAEREAETMLFLGSFRHLPNEEALQWFTRQVLPFILQQKPEAKLVVIGAEPPPSHSLPNSPAIRMRGFVEDILQPLATAGVFVCPILSGSGMRVKLLEAFAAGIPVVSTRIGAEGLATTDGEYCALADEPEEFATRVVELMNDPSRAQQMAAAPANM
ncbi:MAG: glycosyltransferase [Bryobacteraceae bacterium]